MSKPDNPQAFPVAIPETDIKDVEHIAGMTLRDYFAGQAMMGCMDWTRDSAEYQDADEWSRAVAAAYAMADAMLAERAKHE